MTTLQLPKFKGKPLFYYASKGISLDKINKDVKIDKIKFDSFYKISNKKLLKYINKKIEKVKGDFRQKEILLNWEYLLENDEKYFVAKIVIECSSGTYIRAIADDIGKSYEGALLLSLKRTRVGKFFIKDSIE